MKTKRNVFRKMIRLSILILAVVITQSCETDIPLADSIPPTFSFRITGDGFDYTFDQDDDFENLELFLKSGATYNFVFSGSDHGGVANIEWRIEGADNVILADPVRSPWTHRRVSPYPGGTDLIEWHGDRRNPLTGNILAGNLSVTGERYAPRFRFTIVDFGGETRMANTISKELFIVTGSHHSTEIRRW